MALDWGLGTAYRPAADAGATTALPDRLLACMEHEAFQRGRAFRSTKPERRRWIEKSNRIHIAFSEVFSTSYKTLRDYAFTVDRRLDDQDAEAGADK